MLKDKEHPKWRDQKFIAWCAANISESLAMALYSSRETLEEISERLLKGKYLQERHRTRYVPQLSRAHALPTRFSGSWPWVYKDNMAQRSRTTPSS